MAILRRVNWGLVKAFSCGVLLTTFAAMMIFQNTVLYIKQAKVVAEDENTITIRFYHDATDQVLNVRLPIEKFPVPAFHNKSVLHHATVGIWNDDDLRASQMMADDVLNILENRVLKRPQFVTNWTEEMPSPEGR